MLFTYVLRPLYNNKKLDSVSFNRDANNNEAGMRSWTIKRWATKLCSV